MGGMRRKRGWEGRGGREGGRDEEGNESERKQRLEITVSNLGDMMHGERRKWPKLYICMLMTYY